MPTNPVQKIAQKKAQKKAAPIMVLL